MNSRVSPDRIKIRPALREDGDAIWQILEPILREGETYALALDMDKANALAYWCNPANQVFVVELEGRIAGTYYLRPNAGGGGAVMANCGYATDVWCRNQGVAALLCSHSLTEAAKCGYRAMVFNYVISSNAAAVHLWLKMGFIEVGRVPQAFRRPGGTLVDVLVLYRTLS